MNESHDRYYFYDQESLDTKNSPIKVDPEKF